MTYADPRDASYIASANQPHASALASDYAALGAQLERRGIRIDDITRAVANFKVAVPSWGVGTGGTASAGSQALGEPRNVFENSRTARSSTS
jgi:L-rhamnose isomerase/sugar isomerase